MKSSLYHKSILKGIAMKKFHLPLYKCGTQQWESNSWIQAGALYQADLSYDNSEQTKHREKREKDRFSVLPKRIKILQAG